MYEQEGVVEGNEIFCISLNENFKGIIFVRSANCLTNSNNREISVNDIFDTTNFCAIVKPSLVFFFHIVSKIYEFTKIG